MHCYIATFVLRTPLGLVKTSSPAQLRRHAVIRVDEHKTQYLARGGDSSSEIDRAC